MKLSSAVAALPSSGIRRIFEQVAALERAGKKIIRLDIGRPDFATPPFVVAAARKALDEGFTHYVGNRGIPELLQAISDKLRAANGASYDPAREILVTCGGSEAVAVAMLGVLEPGAEVLVPEPNWSHYACCARLAGGTVVPVPLDPSAGFTLDRADLERRVTGRTRMIVLASPNNPTGAVLGHETLLDVLAFARRHGLFVLADEIYEHFVYDGAYTSFAALDGARDLTILVNSFSKAFGMTGWRVGYIAAPAAVCEHLNKPHQYLTVCATSFAQKGAVQAYRHPEAAAFVRHTRDEFRRRRDSLVEAVREVPQLRQARPAGAFYFFPALPDGRLPSSEAALRLIEQAGVATVPGGAFGAAYDGHLRISYGSCPPAELREGMRRIIDLLYR